MLSALKGGVDLEGALRGCRDISEERFDIFSFAGGLRSLAGPYRNELGPPGGAGGLEGLTKVRGGRPCCRQGRWGGPSSVSMGR